MLRLCEPTDGLNIWQINCEDLGYEVPLDLCESQLKKVLKNPEHCIFVYECDGQVVGYIHAQRYDVTYANPLVNVLGLAVKKAYRRNGIGGLLLLMVEDWAREIGSEGIRLNSGARRTAAHAFYEAWGYTCRKEQRNYFKSLID